jgi:hypothetical protein
MVVFSSSALRPAGIYIEDSDTYPGAAWSVPPRLGATEIWRMGGGNLQGVDLAGFGTQDALTAMLAPSPAPAPAPMQAGGLQILVQEAAPLLRYGANATVSNADGSTSLANLRDLMDMRRWANGATSAGWTHGD